MIHNPEQAETYLRDALRRRPNDTNCLLALAELLSRKGDWAGAKACYRSAVQLVPADANIWYQLGAACVALAAWGEARQAFEQLLHLDPRACLGWYGLGRVSKACNDLGAAKECYERAIAIVPFPEALVSLGIVNRQLGLFLDAAENYAEAIRLQPGNVEARTNLGKLLVETGQPEKAVPVYRQALQLRPGDAAIHSSLLMTLNYLEGVSAAELVGEHRQFGVRRASRNVPARARPDAADRRLRIGYVSPDFRNHSVAFFIEPLLARHDRKRFEVYAYYSLAEGDDVTRRLARQVDHWRDGGSLNAEDLARQIQQDQIDILIDLAGHSAYNSLAALADKPAPVQMTYLGYPTTTGLSAIDYRLSDHHVDPPRSEPHSTESVLHLPESYFCYRPPQDSPAVTDPPHERTGTITFGSFNSAQKISTACLELWSRVLRVCPGSRLVLKTWPLRYDQGRQILQEHCRAAGIDEDRVVLLAPQPDTSSHLAVYNDIDVALDTFPYNGATTTCEALWMGVPVVSLTGESHASRMGKSILSAANCGEWAVESAEAYVRLASRLAADRGRLAVLRSTLRPRLLASPLCDEVKFVTDFEALLVQAWQKNRG